MFRLLDLGVAQVGAAGVQGAEHHPVLPVQYEGEESERNVFYTGAAPNQQAIPAVDYLMSQREGAALGAGRHRLRLSAHHQQDPRGLPEVEGRRRKTS